MSTSQTVVVCAAKVVLLPLRLKKACPLRCCSRLVQLTLLHPKKPISVCDRRQTNNSLRSNEWKKRGRKKEEEEVLLSFFLSFFLACWSIQARARHKKFFPGSETVLAPWGKRHAVVMMLSCLLWDSKSLLARPDVVVVLVLFFACISSM